MIQIVCFNCNKHRHLARNYRNRNRLSVQANLIEEDLAPMITKIQPFRIWWLRLVRHAMSGMILAYLKNIMKLRTRTFFWRSPHNQSRWHWRIRVEVHIWRDTHTEENPAHF